jgi:hypothetical protein
VDNFGEMGPNRADAHCRVAGLGLARPDLMHTTISRPYEWATAAGSAASVCRIGQANLDLARVCILKKYGQDYFLPVFPFTELAGQLTVPGPRLKKRAEHG